MTEPEPHGLSLRHPAALICTWFGAGLLPRAPGTWGSLAALPVAWLILDHFGRAWLLAAAAAVFAVGWWAAIVYLRAVREHDPASVVVDEVAGQLLILVAAPLDIVWFGAGFVIFRAFDIVKPWPVSWADSRVGGGLGVMLDDFLAALYGVVLLYSCVQLIG